jgi:hypothetical protein
MPAAKLPRKAIRLRKERGLLKGPRAANAVAADGRPRLDGVIGWSRSAARQAAPQMGDRASADSLRWNLDLALD